MIQFPSNALIIPWDEEQDIVIASDNSGSIGEKKLDDIYVPYDTVSYFAFRVAYMDCIANGGVPYTIVLQNFNDKSAWENLLKGIEKGVKETGINPLPITGSTETNFILQQSATCLTMIGKKVRTEVTQNMAPLKTAVIGKPLVGKEVLTKKTSVAPLSLFQWFSLCKEVIALIPVGSIGIAATFDRAGLEIPVSIKEHLSVYTSSGPSTCFIIVYQHSFHDVIKEKAKHLFFGE